MQLTLRALSSAKSSRSSLSLNRCLRQGNRRATLRCTAGGEGNLEKGLFGDNFGARDPYAAELESNFSEKVLGNYNTDHVIRPPEKFSEIIGLKNKKCVACEGGDIQVLDETEVNRLRLQCPGWRVTTNTAGTAVLACDWKVQNFKAGLDLMHRIGELAESEGHHPDLHLTGYNQLLAEITTHAANGLTENDFILAAKINEIEMSDLLPKRKPKFWA